MSILLKPVYLNSQLTGLFERAIVMSGSLFGPWAISRHPKAAAVSVSLLLGCRAHSSDTELLDCLRSRDVRDILQAFTKHQKVHKLFELLILKHIKCFHWNDRIWTRRKYLRPSSTRSWRMRRLSLAEIQSWLTYAAISTGCASSPAWPKAKELPCLVRFTWWLK